MKNVMKVNTATTPEMSSNFPTKNGVAEIGLALTLMEKNPSLISPQMRIISFQTRNKSIF